MYLKAKSFLVGHKIAVGIVVAVLGVSLGFVFLGGGEKTVQQFAEVRMGDVVQEVAVTGSVKPSEDVSLAFERSGTISHVYADVGAVVSPGQPLLELSNADLIASRASALARLKAEEAKLLEVQRGTRIEEIDVQESKVKSAAISLDDARKNLADKIADAYTRSEDAVHNQVDQFFTNAKSSNPQLTFIGTDLSLKSLIEAERFKMEGILSGWRDSLSVLDLKSESSLAELSSISRSNLLQLKLFLEHVASAVNALNSSSLSQTTIDAYRTSVSTVRANVNTAIVNLTAADEKKRTASSVLDFEERTLALRRAGSTSDEIERQKAVVEQAQAEVASQNVQIGKTVLRSPIFGVVTKQDARLGQSTTPQVQLVTLISQSNLQIEARVPEADIAKIAVGQNAHVTLDAYGSEEVFDARVVKVDPGETVIEGVPTYKVTLQFEKKDTRIRSGMTANVEVLTAKREGVLYIPQRAVISRDGMKIVRLLRNNEIVEAVVQVGVRGSDGSLEIVSGVSVGDKVLTSSK